MEATGSSDTAVLTRAKRRNISEDDILHSHHRENLKFFPSFICLKDILEATLSSPVSSLYISSQTFVRVARLWLCRVWERNLKRNVGLLVTKPIRKIEMSGLHAAVVVQTVRNGRNGLNVIVSTPPSFLILSVA
jgi:hypothetical protein